MPKVQIAFTRHTMARAASLALVSTATALLLTACLFSDDSTPAAPGDTGGTGTGTGGTGQSIAGTVVKGLVSGSTVTVYVLNADGSLGAALGSATTSSTGAYTVALSSAPTGAVALVAVGGTYVSEVDGSTVIKASDLMGALASVPATGATGVIITPLSDMMVARARALAAAGTALADALAAAETLVKSTYGIAAGTALETVLPTYDKASIGTDAFLIGLVLGSLDKCDSAVPALRGNLFAALSADFSDGVFDGKKAGTAITVGTGTSALSSTAGTSDFLSCVSGYVTTGKAITDAGITATDVAATTTAVRTALVASSATPKSTGLSASSSGAISSLAYSGKQWVFIAARSQGVVAIDVTDPTAAAPTVKVFSSLVTNFGGLEIGGVVPLQGADHPQLLVFAYGSKHIALVNADTGVVEYEADLPLVATSPVSFSGGSAYIAGAIPDTGRDGAWLATADGYLFFDRATRTLTTSYPLGMGSELAENLGGDTSHGMLFAPNYTPAVQLVDLTAGKSYYLDGPAFASAFPTTPGGTTTSLSEPDAGSVDTGLQVGIVTNEDTDDVGFINLKTVVKTDVVGGKSTFVPGMGGTAVLKLNQPTLSGSAVDSDTHLALFMAGYSSDIAVGMLQDPASVAIGGTWVGMTDWRYVNNLPNYSYAADPHAVAVIKNLSNSKAYGYLLDGGSHMSFQIDMAAVLAVPAVGTTGADQHRVDSASPALAAAVKQITW
jgi:hypothetical protein